MRRMLTNHHRRVKKSRMSPFPPLSPFPPPPLPAAPSDICSLGGTFLDDGGHSEWTDGKVANAGFTAALAPNAKTACQQGGKVYDADWLNQMESAATSGIVLISRNLPTAHT